MGVPSDMSNDEQVPSRKDELGPAFFCLLSLLTFGKIMPQ